MAAPPPRIAEGFLVLVDRCEGILTRVHHLQKLLGNPKNLATLQSFNIPEIMDVVQRISREQRVPSHMIATDQVVQYYKETIMLDMCSIGLYQTLEDLYELRLVVLAFLGDVYKEKCSFNMGSTFELSRLLMELLSKYMVCFLLFGRASLFRCYAQLYMGAAVAAGEEMSQTVYVRFLHHPSIVIRSQRDPKHFQAVEELLNLFDSFGALTKLAEELEGLTKIVQPPLGFVRELYRERTDGLNGGWLSLDVGLVAQGNTMPLFSRWSAEHSAFVDNPMPVNNLPYGHFTESLMANQCDLISTETLELWIFCGYVICSRSMQKKDGLELFSKFLEQTTHITLFRDEIIDLNSLIKFYKKEPKVKNPRPHDVHAMRRRDLPLVMEDLLRMLRADLGVIPIKMPLILKMLNFARDEIAWVLSANFSRQPDLSLQSVPQLVHVLEELRELVLKHADHVKSYYMQLIMQFDTQALGHYGGQSRDMGPFIQAIFQFLSGMGQTVSVEPGALIAIRVDWLRYQVHFSREGGFMAAPEPAALEAIGRMDALSAHSRLVDQLPAVLDRVSSLKCFYAHAELLTAVYEQMVASTDVELCRLACLYPALVAAHFPAALHPLCPEERTYMAMQAHSIVDRFSQKEASLLAEHVSHLWQQTRIITNKLSWPIMAGIYCRTQKEIRYPSRVKRIRQNVAHANFPWMYPPLDAFYIRRKIEEKHKFDPEKLQRTLQDFDNQFTFVDEMFHLQQLVLGFGAAIQQHNLLDVMGKPLRVSDLVENKVSHAFNIALGKVSRGDVGAEPPSVVQAAVDSFVQVVALLGRVVEIDWVNVVWRVTARQSAKMLGGVPTFASTYADAIKGKVKNELVYNGTAVLSRLQQAALTRDRELSTRPQDEHVRADPDSAARSAPVDFLINRPELNALVGLIGPYGIATVTKYCATEIANNLKHVMDYTIHYSPFIENEVLSQLNSWIGDAGVPGTELFRHFKDDEIFSVLSAAQLISCHLVFLEIATMATEMSSDNIMPLHLSLVRSANGAAKKRSIEMTSEVDIADIAGMLGVDGRCTQPNQAVLGILLGKELSCVESDVTESSLTFRLLALLFVFIPRLLSTPVPIDYSTYFDGPTNNMATLGRGLGLLMELLLCRTGPAERHEICTRLFQILGIIVVNTVTENSTSCPYEWMSLFYYQVADVSMSVGYSELVSILPIPSTWRLEHGLEEVGPQASVSGGDGVAPEKGHKGGAKGRPAPTVAPATPAPLKPGKVLK